MAGGPKFSESLFLEKKKLSDYPFLSFLLSVHCN